jgi:hypothetical protein
MALAECCILEMDGILRESAETAASDQIIRSIAGHVSQKMLER